MRIRILKTASFLLEPESGCTLDRAAHLSDAHTGPARTGIRRNWEIAGQLRSRDEGTVASSCVGRRALLKETPGTLLRMGFAGQPPAPAGRGHRSRGPDLEV